jgi:Zn-dependent peptidase ImmA (M78 family)/DNA-binding XRE family transcriptional regulator
MSLDRVAPSGVRSELIVLAREARGYTQTELAATLGLSQGHLSKIEGGLLPLSETLLERLARVLDYPPHFFALPEPIYGPGTSEFFHRKRKAISGRLLARLHAQVNIQRIQVGRLLQAVEIEADRIPEMDPEAFPGSVEEVARAVRATWNLPRGPIENVTATIEAAGGIVIMTDFGTALLDAVSRWVPGMPPLFFTNRESPGDRQRLTLAHELGHMVMHHVPNADMEAQAMRFAAEFLMPERDIRHELEGFTLDRLIALKVRWRVSMQALLARAQTLDRITARQARYLWMQISKAGFRVREPVEADVPREHPALLAEIIDLYRHTLGYSPDDIADLIAVNPGELESVYGVSLRPREARARLRVVNAGAGY